MSIEKAKELGKQVGSKTSCLRLSLIKDFNDEELMAFVDIYAPTGPREYDNEYCAKIVSLFKDYFANNDDETIALGVYNCKDGITQVSEKVYKILISVCETGKLNMRRDFPDVFLSDEERHQLVLNITTNHTGRGIVSENLKQYGFNKKVKALIDGGRYMDENGVGRWGGGVTIEQLAGLTAEEIRYVCSYLVDGDMDHKMSVAVDMIKQLHP